MGIFGKKKVSFIEPFDEKYKLLVTSDIRTGNMTIESQVEIRWDVRVRAVSENRIHLELLTLDNRLISCNNPIVKSMADMNRLFSGLYSELDLVLDGDYRLVEIKNLDLLATKWQRIKAELEETIGDEPELLGTVINLNDKNFESPDLLLDLVVNNEFFMIYFHHLYGCEIPSTTGCVAKKNIFNTAMVEWRYRYTEEDRTDDCDEYAVDGFLNTKLNKDWVKKHYAGFTHLDLNKIRPVMTEEGVYRINSHTGQILEATLTKEEIAHPEILYGTIRYELMPEKPDAGHAKEDEHMPKTEAEGMPSRHQPPAGYNPEHSFIIDDDDTNE